MIRYKVFQYLDVFMILSGRSWPIVGGTVRRANGFDIGVSGKLAKITTHPL